MYEAHARLALQAADHGEFGQCQSQLVPLHARGLSRHRDEFVAYRVLHCLATQSAALSQAARPPPRARSHSLSLLLSLCVLSLSAHARARTHTHANTHTHHTPIHVCISQDLHVMLGGMSLVTSGAAVGGGSVGNANGSAGGAAGGAGGGADGGAVAQAVRVGVALQTGDFRTFFRELARMHNLGREILKPLLPAQRAAALAVICRAYHPSLPVARVASLLSFPGGAAEAGPWLRGLGGVIVRGGETGSEPQLECRATAQALRDLRSGVEAGPPLPPSTAR